MAKDNLGTLPGLVAAASLMIDYVLTVSVSVSAGVQALATLFPALSSTFTIVSIDVALVLFIMLVNLRDPLGSRLGVHATLSGIVGVSVVGIILYVYSTGRLARSLTLGPPTTGGGGNIQLLGDALYRDYLLPFEIASILLLVAMIGAIVLARQKY